MKTSKELKNEITRLQAQLSVVIAKEKAELTVVNSAKFNKMSNIISHESDGIREWDTILMVFHSGIEFDFSKALSERDHDGRRALLSSLEAQGLCAVIEE